MKIAVTGEGPTDYGRYNLGIGCWEWGPIAAYITKIAKTEGKTIELHPIPREEVQKLKLQMRSTAGLKGKGIPARKFSVLMNKSGCDAGIYYCDTDRESGTNNNNRNAAEKHYREVYDEVAGGLTSSKAIPMIAMRMIECWIISDKKALEKVFAVALSDRVIPPYPEMIWGDKRDPNSNYPKHYFTRMIRESNKRYRAYESNAKDYCDVAIESNIEVLREKCNISFAKFYEDFVGLLREA